MQRFLQNFILLKDASYIEKHKIKHYEKKLD